MRAVVFVSAIFLSFGIGVSAAYALLSSPDTDARLIYTYQNRDMAHENIKVRGKVVGLDAQTNTMILESPSPFLSDANVRLLIDYSGSKTNNFGTVSSTSVSSVLVGSFVSIVIRNQTGPLQADIIAIVLPQ
ncbi:hypothetical protein EXS56_02325 [Candidatus Kaiserbacteria bacterium]|nr:hypothetical protein [Candidatus Kaiserbacteria bacterium]